MHFRPECEASSVIHMLLIFLPLLCACQISVRAFGGPRLGSVQYLRALRALRLLSSWCGKVNRQWWCYRWLLCVYVRERTDQLRCTTPRFNYFRPGFPHLTAHLKSLGLSATRMVSIAPCPSRLLPLPFPLCSLLVFLAPRYPTHHQNHTQVGIITVIVSFLVIFALIGMSAFGGSRENASYCSRGGDLQFPRRRCSWMAMQSNGSNVLPLTGDLPVIDVCILRQAQECDHVLLSCFDALTASKVFSKYVICAQEDIRVPAAGRDVTQARPNVRSLQGWIPLTVTLTTHACKHSHTDASAQSRARAHTHTHAHTVGTHGFETISGALAITATLLNYLQHPLIILPTVDGFGHGCLFFFCALTVFGSLVLLNYVTAIYVMCYMESIGAFLMCLSVNMMSTCGRFGVVTPFFQNG